MFSEVKSDIAADESEKNRYDVDMIRFLTEAWDKWKWVQIGMIAMKDYDFLYGKMNTIASAASKVVPGTLAILKKKR